jgi:hypothetical protein
MTNSQIFIFLLQKGVYPFLGMPMIFSLCQDYKVLPIAYAAAIGIVSALLVWLQGLIFWTSFELIEFNIPFTYEENKDFFVLISSGSLSFSVVCKVIILKEKYKKIIISNL